MPAAYSYDLRKKVIQALDAGEGKTAVAKRLKLAEQHYTNGKSRTKKFAPSCFLLYDISW